MVNKLIGLRSQLREMKKQADETLVKYYDFLVPGVWKSSEYGLTFYKKGYKKQAGFENAFFKKFFVFKADLSGTEKLASILFLVFYRFKKKGQVKDYQQVQALSFNSHKTAAKAFNFDSKFLLTVYNEMNDMTKYLTNRQLWENAGNGVFSVPPILEINTEKLFVKETLLDKLPFSTEEGFEAIISDYLRYFEAIGKEKELGVVSEEQAEKMINIAKQLNIEDIGYRALSFMRSSEYRINLSHGDLFRLNLIKTPEKYYYIDFEIVEKRCFFFDVFKYMVTSSDYGTDLLKLYLEGVYDTQIGKLFELNGATFVPDNRKIYLFVFEMISRSFGFYLPIWNYKDVWKNENNAISDIKYGCD